MTRWMPVVMVLALGHAIPLRAAVGGVVLDAFSGAPVANAQVRHPASGSSVVTNVQGRFTFPVISVIRVPGLSRGGSGSWSFHAGPLAASFHSIGSTVRAYDPAGRIRRADAPAWRPSLFPHTSRDLDASRAGEDGQAAGIGQSAGEVRTPYGLLAKPAAAPCLLSVEATGYKPAEANCTETEDNTVRIAAETAIKFYYKVPVDAGDGLVPGDLSAAVPNAKALLDGLDSLAAKRYKEVHSLLVIKGDKLVLEEYYKGTADTIDFEKGIKRMPVGNIHWTRTGKHYIASANKAFTSILTGMALAKGNKPVTTTLAPLLPKYQAQFTGTKANITVEHALTMTLGFQWDEWAGTDLSAMWATQDIGAYVMAKPMAAAPGAQWIYNSAGPNLLLAAMESLVGGDVVQYAKDNLYGPLGIEDFRWGKQPNGLPEGSAKMFMRPRDMAKIGLLFKQGGMWNGRQVVPADWVATSTQFKRSALPKNPNDYAFLWWVRKVTTPKGTVVNYYQAEGDGGQYVVVLPAQDLVVVATGGNYGDFGTYDAQMGRLLARHVLPALNL